MLKTKSIYAQIEPDDGLRLLVMRYWPRGVKKDRVSMWLKDLGPTPELIKSWKTGRLTWDEFKDRYRLEFNGAARRDAFNSLKAAIKTSGNVTLICSCADEDRCHRGLLKELLEEE
ncbi:MAG: hypothetical protein A3J24_01110 [Deltaproteobacteria bacterium RIFCSPLOWO2_02_FULL_53_8]|nr:MAG: hypothetical protein A3J24_01110 [Deltaproteobacteria bacterium RIFCSPLOWO2_02_FULL_53_8]